MNADVSLTSDTIVINGNSYDLRNVEGSFIIKRQMIKLIYAFLGLVWLIVAVLVAFITLTQVTSVPGNLSYLVLALMAYPSFLIGRAIMKRFYVPELVIMSNGIVILRIVEWPRNRPVVETIRNRVTNIKISYPLNPLYGAR
jgi:hypothetical protein